MHRRSFLINSGAALAGITIAGSVKPAEAQAKTAEPPMFGPGPDFSHVPKKFRFVVNADPQMGPQGDTGENMRVFNLMWERFAVEVEEVDPKPAFSVIDGDLVHNPLPASFANFKRIIKDISHPLVLVHGNHDGRWPDTQYTDLQKELCGYEALSYTFDAGDWHFMVIPSPQMIQNRQAELALLDWMRKDLEKNAKRPTMLLFHYHMLPLGITQMEFYTIRHEFRMELIDLITSVGDVRYSIGGHVHSGIKASEKISFKVKNTVFMIAPSPIYPRPFGEEYPEFLKEGEYNAGYWMIVDVDGDKVKFTGRKLFSDAEREMYTDIPEWDFEGDPRSHKQMWELPKSNGIKNGNFNEGMAGWGAPYRYMRDEDPCYVMKPVSHQGKPAAYIRTKHCGTTWWANDEFTEVYQILDRPTSMDSPVVSWNYQVPSDIRPSFGGGFIRLAMYSGNERKLVSFFHWGAREYRLRYFAQCVGYTDEGQGRVMSAFMRQQSLRRITFFRIPDHDRHWIPAAVNLREVFDFASPGREKFETANIDRILVAAGTWIGNELGTDSAAYFTDFALENQPDAGSKIDGSSLVMDDMAYVPVYGVIDFDGGRS